MSDLRPECVIVNQKYPDKPLDSAALQRAADQLKASLPQKIIKTDQPVRLTKPEVERDIAKILSSYEVGGLLLNNSTGAKVEDAVAGYLMEAMRQTNVDRFDFFIDFVSSKDPDNVSTVVDNHRWDRADGSIRYVQPVATKNFGYIFVLVVDRDQFIRNNPDRVRSITSKLFLGGLQ